jgi:hypothetical protein
MAGSFGQASIRLTPDRNLKEHSSIRMTYPLHRNTLAVSRVPGWCYTHIKKSASREKTQQKI